jgi:hypothetical protein
MRAPRIEGYFGKVLRLPHQFLDGRIIQHFR